MAHKRPGANTDQLTIDVIINDRAAPLSLGMQAPSLRPVLLGTRDPERLPLCKWRLPKLGLRVHPNLYLSRVNCPPHTCGRTHKGSNSSGPRSCRTTLNNRCRSPSELIRRLVGIMGLRKLCVHARLDSQH